MKIRDIVIITLCTVAALVCIALTFWGNIKNDGILTTDSYIGVVATLIGVCATIVVGFQIASFVKIHETEKQIKEVKTERDNMQKEKEQFLREIKIVEDELSNAFVMLSKVSKNTSTKILAQILSIRCSNISKEADVTLLRYQILSKSIKKAQEDNELSEIKKVSLFVDKLKFVDVPKNIEHYTEIMKLHLEIIEALEKYKVENKEIHN